jgi:hypothetical protein
MSALTGDGAQALGYRTALPAHEQPEWRMSEGAIGCAASHIEVYRRIAAADAPGAIVLEDDVVFGDDFVARAQHALDARSSRTVLLSLGWTFYEDRARTRLIDAVYAVARRGRRDRLAGEPFGFGAFCYWVGREFALAAPDLMTPMYAPLDAMLCAITHYSSWQSERHWPPLAGVDDTRSDIR